MTTFDQLPCLFAFRRAAPLLLVLAGCAARAPTDPVTIAQVIPMSGPDRRLGDRARQGAQLALEETRVPGRSFAVRHVDSRGDADLVQAQVVRLIVLNRVAALLGGPDRVLAERLARTAQPYGVPVLLPADLAAPPVGEAAFCLTVAPETRGTALARFVTGDLKARRVVALIDANDETAAAVASAFAREWRYQQREEKSAILEEWPLGSEMQRSEAIGHVAKVQPDVVLLATSPGDLSGLRGQIAATRCKMPILYGGPDVGENLVETERGTGSTLYLATIFARGGLTAPDGLAFARLYEERFREPPDLTAAQAYDGVQLLIEELARAKSTGPGQLRDALLEVDDFAAVTGPLSLKERRAKRRLFIVAIQAGEAKVIRTFAPNLE